MLAASNGTVAPSAWKMGAQCLPAAGLRLAAVCQQLPTLSSVANSVPGAACTRLTSLDASQTQLALRADGGDPGLIDSDNAAPVMGAALQRLKDTQGEDAAKAAWDATGLQLSAFLFAVTPLLHTPLRTGTCPCSTAAMVLDLHAIGHDAAASKGSLQGHGERAAVKLVCVST